MKTNLPVIILKNLVLLPYNQIKLEFKDGLSKSIIDTSELFHDDNIFVITQINPLEENIDIANLPSVGVIAKITQKIELPNGITRIVISGKVRASVIEYLKQDGIISETIVSKISEQSIPNEKENIMINKLQREIKSYIKIIPSISNSLLSILSNETNLSKFTDIVVNSLSLTSKRLLQYLMECSSFNRAKMILNDIYNEKQLFDLEKDLDLKVKKELDKNQKEIILKEKLKQIKKELKEFDLKEFEVSSLNEKLNSFKCPKNIKDRIKLELNKYENISDMSPELSIVRNYIDWLMSLPWSIKTKDNESLIDVKSQLDKTHYGLDEVKDRIIEYLAVKKQTNSLNSPIICLVGPPGVGKTTLAYSISKALNRKFTKISLGGISDEAEIVGHRKTYLAAFPGRIIDGLKRAGSNNPVFLIDEIDKITKGENKDPASTLLEVLDKNQNKHFKDNYINEEFDLSNVMFILTANYIDEIPLALKDRLEIINIREYTLLEKLDIAKKHIIPKILKEHNLDNIDISEKNIIKIINEYTKEAGVRELERQLSKIARKVVTEKVLNNKTINKISNIKTYLSLPKFENNKIRYQESGVVNGLCYTGYGGDVLPIEVTYFEGNGKLVLTGSLGSVMQESATMALSYIKSNCNKFNISINKLIKSDIHIHIPFGSIKKEGPSAGVALTTAIISAILNKKVSNNIAFTGEMTLLGQVLAIGGLKEKCFGAYKNNIERIIFPLDNEKEIIELPKEITDSIKFIPVKNYQEVYDYIDLK